jgi:hypothetical protein
MISIQERLQIEILPPVAQIPNGYVPIPGSVLQMGKHWVDPTSDEFTGKGFTHTFLFGSYNGPITFYEPMITFEYLQSKAETALTLLLITSTTMNLLASI